MESLPARGTCFMFLILAVAVLLIAPAFKSNPKVERAYEHASLIGGIINSGEDRTPNESGELDPPIPRHDFLMIRARAQEALHILERKLHSENQIVRANAYEFLTDLANVPSTRQRALSLLQSAIPHETPDLQPVLRKKLDILLPDDDTPQ